MNWINHSKAELLDCPKEDECLGLVSHLDADKLHSRLMLIALQR